MKGQEGNRFNAFGIPHWLQRDIFFLKAKYRILNLDCAILI